MEVLNNTENESLVINNFKNGKIKHDFNTNLNENYKNPKLSLIIPVFQEEKILEQRLKYITENYKQKFNY